MINEYSWKQYFSDEKYQNSQMTEKKIDAHRLAYAIYCESAYQPTISTLARVLHYDENQLKKDMVSLYEYLNEIETELK